LLSASIELKNMDDDYERVLLVKNQCFVYKLPPRPSVSRGYRAADWKLDQPEWTCRMRIVSKSNKVQVKLEDKVSGNLFAQAPIDEYPGVAIESVTDSSRYFVLRIMDDSGRKAFIGVGFQDRGDSFDFNVALQDHFKQIKNEQELSQNTAPQPNLNLGLKEGQTFTIKLGNKPNKPRPKPTNALGSGFLPPPPRAASTSSSGFLPPPPSNTSKQTAPTVATGSSDWGEFSSAPTNSGSSSSSTTNQWMQF